MKIISKAKENRIRPPSSNPLFRLRFLKSHKTNQKLWPGRLDFMPTKLKLVWAFCGLWKRALIHFSAFSNSLFLFFPLQSVYWNSLSTENPRSPSKLRANCVWYGHFRAFRLKLEILRMIFFNVSKFNWVCAEKAAVQGLDCCWIYYTSSNLILIMAMMLMTTITIMTTMIFLLQRQTSDFSIRPNDYSIT